MKSLTKGIVTRKERDTESLTTLIVGAIGLSFIYFFETNPILEFVLLLLFVLYLGATSILKIRETIDFFRNKKE